MADTVETSNGNFGGSKNFSCSDKVNFFGREMRI